MKAIKTIIILWSTLVIFPLTYGQTSSRDFSDILQTYYLHKDKDLVEQTIAFSNSPDVTYQRLEPIYTGFYGALFASDPEVRKKIMDNIDQFEDPQFKELFIFLNETPIDSIYSRTPLSPAYNDMNWSSYFATGKVSYLDQIIANIPLADDRTDVNLFVTGASAKWSLCSNARQDEKIKEYLTTQKKNKALKEILKKDPSYYKEEMIGVIKAQRAKGLWK